MKLWHSLSIENTFFFLSVFSWSPDAHILCMHIFSIEMKINSLCLTGWKNEKKNSRILYTLTMKSGSSNIFVWVVRFLFHFFSLLCLDQNVSVSWINFSMELNANVRNFIEAIIFYSYFQLKWKRIEFVGIVVAAQFLVDDVDGSNVFLGLKIAQGQIAMLGQLNEHWNIAFEVCFNASFPFLFCNFIER